MPKLFSVGPYSIYFWSNENDPLEPIHVHISEGRATKNATKYGSPVPEKPYFVITDLKFLQGF